MYFILLLVFCLKKIKLHLKIAYTFNTLFKEIPTYTLIKSQDYFPPTYMVIWTPRLFGTLEYVLWLIQPSIVFGHRFPSEFFGPLYIALVYFYLAAQLFSTLFENY